MCRREGLDRARRCAWSQHKADSTRVVWARAGHTLTTCPKSYISAESLRWLELFHVHRHLGTGDAREMPARDVEALCVLENEWNAEKRREQE